MEIAFAAVCFEVAGPSVLPLAPALPRWSWPGLDRELPRYRKLRRRRSLLRE